jgi:hypothetical protein
LRRTGFISVAGISLAAKACIACAIPISPPSRVTYEFRLIFWDLKGATPIPRLTRQRQIAATVTLLPTWDAEPTTKRDMPVLHVDFWIIKSRFSLTIIQKTVFKPENTPSSG